MIYLTDLPQNILDIYFKSLKQDCTIISNIPDVNIETYLGPPMKAYCYMRLLYKDNKFYYKIFNYYDSSLPDFIEKTKYDLYFEKAIKHKFYNNISLVNDFIYDEINCRYIGYKYPIINEIININNEKLNNLINRLIIQSKLTNLVHVDIVNHNILEYNNKYYIIDLECITSLNIYKDNNIRLKYFTNNNIQYKTHLLT